MTTQKTESLGAQDTINKYFPFFLEIRRRILFLVSVFLIASACGFVFYERIITFTLSLLNVEGVNIVFTSPFQFINLAISSAFVVGLVATFPLIIVQVFSFLKPALRKKEYRVITSLLPLSIILFVTGFGFGLTMMRYVVVLFFEKSLELNIGNYLDISMLLSKILLTATMMGLAFQFPIILSILMRLGIIKYRAVAKQRFVAWAISLVFAALLPPTDLLSLLLLTLPLVILFEFTLLFNRIFLRSHLL